MKTFRPLLSAYALAMTLFFVGCTSNSTASNSTNPETISSEALSMAQRGTQTSKTQSAQEMGYKTLVRFEKGMANMDITTLSALQDKQVSLVVFYESDALWADSFSKGDFQKTGNDILNGLMESYELIITKHLALDDFNEVIILENPTGIIKDALKAATDFSMIDNVLMVELKENPAGKNTTETVSN